jgi:ATP-dependent DNA ligase
MTLEQSLEAVEQAARGNARLAELTHQLTFEGIVPGILDTFLTFAFHPGITFGVAAITEPETEGNEPIQPFKLFELCQNLQSRNLTGNAARGAILAFIQPLKPVSRKWALRLLRRDLRLDLGLKDANKALKAANMPLIPVFEVPLAKKYTDVKKFAGDWAVQPKFDGARVVVRITPDKEVTLFSRTGKEWKGFKSIKAAFAEFASTLKEESWLEQTLYFDGEVVTYVDGKVNFQVIQKMMMRDDDLEIGTLKYVAFDVATEDEWFNSQRTYRQRYAHAELLIGLGTERISLVKSQTVSGLTHKALESFCDEYVAADLEGSMARKLDETVALKRSSTLVKCKNFTDDEFEVIGMIEGKGKIAGMMGTLVCKMKDGKLFEIGTGFSEKDRTELWGRPEVIGEYDGGPLWGHGGIVGQFAVGRYQQLTDGGVPRIPSFKGLRSKDDFRQEDE